MVQKLLGNNAINNESRVKQFRQNRTFKNNQRHLFEELDEKMMQEQVILDPEKSIKFWSEL